MCAHQEHPLSFDLFKALGWIESSHNQIFVFQKNLFCFMHAQHLRCFDNHAFMVLILDRNSYMLRTHEGKFVSSEKKIRFVTALDPIEGLKQIKSLILLLTCLPISELPSNISIMHAWVLLPYILTLPVWVIPQLCNAAKYFGGMLYYNLIIAVIIVYMISLRSLRKEKTQLTNFNLILTNWE